MDINTAQETLHKPEMVGDEHLIVNENWELETLSKLDESKITHRNKTKSENRTGCR